MRTVSFLLALTSGVAGADPLAAAFGMSTVESSSTSLQLTSRGARSGGQADASAECMDDSDCASPYFCNQAQCVAPRSKRGASLQRQATELYLSSHAVELREELVLGRGPVITTLAGATSVPAPVLGRLLRTNRLALLAEMGKPDWAGRFLRRTEALAFAARSTL